MFLFATAGSTLKYNFRKDVQEANGAHDTRFPNQEPEEKA
jgi:hypothetical protein